MMEENQSPLTCGASVDGSTSDGVKLLMAGEVYSRGKAHQLYVTNAGVRLMKPHTQDKTRIYGSFSPVIKPHRLNIMELIADVAVLEVQWSHVLCASEVPVKKSKSLLNNSDSGASGSDCCSFVIHYSVKNQKTNKVQCKNITLEARAGNAYEWISHIEEQCKQGKPRKLLVIINPIGGKGTARQTFEKRVQPLFLLAGIELIVKVTERAKHAVEIAKTFDVSSVDGVIAVGGDGMYMEILHGLILRRQEEEGVDFDDPDATLCPPSVTVGIIPAGTGNGVSEWLNGVIDLDTATLNIIRGETRRTNIFSVHESRKLIHYAGLLLGNGYFSLMIQRTDELRWMKRARYPYAMVSSLLKKKQILEFDVEVLKNQPEQAVANGKGSDDGKTEGAAEAMSSGWTKLGTKRLVATMAFSAKILEENGKLRLHPFYPGFDFFLIDRSSALENFKFIMSFFTRSRQALEKDYVEWIQDIRGARFRMVDRTGADTDQRQQDQLTELCKLLDVDGEVMHLTSPQFDVRLHPQFLPVFCAPELYSAVPV
ncbi:hypothetical protein ACOMHN_002310 [Nucella lapillus]